MAVVKIEVTGVVCEVVATIVGMVVIGVVYVYLVAAEVAVVPLVVMTVMSTVPVEPEGEIAVTEPVEPPVL